MSAYLIPIQTAMIVFPILALGLTLPYILHQYRTYGATLPSRILIVFSFIFYLLCCYFLVSLPLPPIHEVANDTSSKLQLIPFASLKEITLTTSLVWNDPSTYLTALNEPSVLQVLFNILMSVPFGIYLRYYFRYSLRKTLLFSFLLSLSFELLQLSGLFFLYPRPYRIFDVDDLITNTLGGMLGYAIAPLLAHFLPTREQLDEKSYHKGQQVSAFRRLFALSIDVLLLAICFGGYVLLNNNRTYDGYVYALLLVLLFFLLPIITKGQTLGKKAVKLTLVSLEEKPIVWYQYLFHFLPIYAFLVPSPLILTKIMLHFTNAKLPERYGWYALFALCIACYLYYLTSAVSSLLHHTSDRYERLSKTKNVSTISSQAKQTTDEEESTLEQHQETVVSES